MAFASSPAFVEMKSLREANQQTKENKDGNKNYLSALLAAFPKINPALMSGLQAQSDVELQAKLYAFRYFFKELDQKKIEGKLSGIWKASNKDWLAFAEGVSSLNDSSKLLKDAAESSVLIAEETKSAFNAKAFITELFNHFTFEDLLDEAGYINPEAKANLEQAHKALDLLKPTIDSSPAKVEHEFTQSDLKVFTPTLSSFKPTGAPTISEEEMKQISENAAKKKQPESPAEDNTQIPVTDSRKAPAEAATDAPKTPTDTKEDVSLIGLEELATEVKALSSALGSSTDEKASKVVLSLIHFTTTGDTKAKDLLISLLDAYYVSNYSTYQGLVNFINYESPLWMSEENAEEKKKRKNKKAGKFSAKRLTRFQYRGLKEALALQLIGAKSILITDKKDKAVIALADKYKEASTPAAKEDVIEDVKKFFKGLSASMEQFRKQGLIKGSKKYYTESGSEGLGNIFSYIDAKSLDESEVDSSSEGKGKTQDGETKLINSVKRAITAYSTQPLTSEVFSKLSTEEQAEAVKMANAILAAQKEAEANKNAIDSTAE